MELITPTECLWDQLCRWQLPRKVGRGRRGRTTWAFSLLIIPYSWLSVSLTLSHWEKRNDTLEKVNRRSFRVGNNRRLECGISRAPCYSLGPPVPSPHPVYRTLTCSWIISLAGEQSLFWKNCMAVSVSQNTAKLLRSGNVPPNLCAGNLILNTMVLGGVAFARYLRQRDSTFTNGIHCHKKAWWRNLALSYSQLLHIALLPSTESSTKVPSGKETCLLLASRITRKKSISLLLLYFYLIFTTERYRDTDKDLISFVLFPKCPQLGLD